MVKTLSPVVLYDGAFSLGELMFFKKIFGRLAEMILNLTP